MNNSVVLKPSLEFPEVTQTTCEVFSPIFPFGFIWIVVSTKADIMKSTQDKDEGINGLSK